MVVAVSAHPSRSTPMLELQDPAERCSAKLSVSHIGGSCLRARPSPTDIYIWARALLFWSVHPGPDAAERSPTKALLDTL
ncbi:hypothetical protein PGT21_008816 [Puccinia graminis f. sp. tritici]|uniref:Uncharacterized protein n=1 Tax=Puccinia graminis f. sp. tritici TaxID=56615 RepID=A0A5B0LJ19_PUCGR|nr:hypothetical protein PGT21_008816 [Puccinia graminis f. sp. tritici]